MAKKKILVVEDDPHVLQTLKDRLESQGYEVITAKDGEIGLTRAKVESPDLILLDVMLPIKHGYTICWFLKSEEKYRHIPIIMLTARTQAADIALGKDVGADAYITKPYDMETLLSKISELLGSAIRPG